MAFTVQDDLGTINNANSVIDVAFFKAYHADRGNATAGDGTFTDTEIQQACVRATDYVDSRWRRRFLGTKKGENQGTEFPRDNLVDRNGFDLSLVIPPVLKQAVAEYALRALSNPLAPDPVVDATGQQLKRKKEVVGPLTEETEYIGTDGNQPVLTFTPYPLADAMVFSLLKSGGRVVRA